MGDLGVGLLQVVGVVVAVEEVVVEEVVVEEVVVDEVVVDAGVAEAGVVVMEDSRSTIARELFQFSGYY